MHVHQQQQQPNRLTALVEEVAYFESEARNERLRCEEATQALVDSVDAHGKVLDAYGAWTSALLEGSSHANDLEQGVTHALEELGRFQQGLQRRLMAVKIILPNSSTYSATMAWGPAEYDDVKQVSLELRSENEKILRKIEVLESKNNSLEKELQEAINKNTWPFSDNGHNDMDSFGIYSSPDQYLGANVDHETEISHLRKLLEQQENSFKERETALLRQAQIELSEAELTIKQLRSTKSSLTPSPSKRSIPDDSPRRRRQGVKILENDEIIHERNDPVDNTASIILDRNLRGRVKDLETSLAEQKAATATLQCQLELAEAAKQQALSKIEQVHMERNVNQEELETERCTQLAIREKVEQVQRDCEVWIRKYRASEKRHEGVLEEMRQVMEERDRALRRVETSNQKYKEGLLELDDTKEMLVTERARYSKLLEDLRVAQQEFAQANEKCESFKRKNVKLEQDIELMRDERESLYMDRESSLKEIQFTTERMETYLDERKMACDSRDAAQKQVDTLFRKLEEAEETNLKLSRSMNLVEENAEDLQRKLKKSLEVTDNLNETIETLQKKLDNSENDRIAVQHDREMAERQVQVLLKELKNALRSRDLGSSQQLALRMGSEIFGEIENDSTLDRDLDEVVSHRMSNGSEQLQTIQDLNDKVAALESALRQHVPKPSQDGVTKDKERNHLAGILKRVEYVNDEWQRLSRSLDVKSVVGAKHIPSPRKPDETARSISIGKLYLQINEFLEYLQEVISQAYYAMKTTQRAQNTELNQAMKGKLHDALEHLRVAENDNKEMKSVLREHVYKLNRVEMDRDSLATELKNANAKLKKLSGRKQNARRELEEVYESINLLEAQLLSTQAENQQLRDKIEGAGNLAEAGQRNYSPKKSKKQVR